MLEGCKSAEERWESVSRLIDNWLNGRQELLVLYCSLSGVERLQVDERPFCEKMQHFCQMLVDYVSAGHFEIYEQLKQEAVEFNDDAALDSTAALFDAIQRTTEFCLDVNDGIDKFSDIQSLQVVLSKLGECLEERFAFEDRVIEILHNSHEKAVIQ